jgi:threonine/homoserine/homoserine lactone efflux protein
MTLATFAAAVLGLLLAPGPSNTLMGLAGAQGGVLRVLRLLPAELAGYLAAILPLVLVGRQVLDPWPGLAAAVKVLAAAWVMALAVKLWRARGQGVGLHAIDARTVFVTTLLNPKALIFGLVLLPLAADPAFAGRLALFCVMVAAVALAWGAAGRLTQAGRGGASRLRLVQRVAAVWLASVSIGMALSTIPA